MQRKNTDQKHMHMRQIKTFSFTSHTLTPSLSLIVSQPPRLDLRLGQQHVLLKIAVARGPNPTKGSTQR